MVAPLSTAGVSEYTVSVATDSLHQCTFRARFGNLKCFFRMVLVGMQAYCVVASKVCLIMSIDNNPKSSHRALQSCSLGVIVVMGVVCGTGVALPSVVGGSARGHGMILGSINTAVCGNAPDGYKTSVPETITKY